MTDQAARNYMRVATEFGPIQKRAWDLSLKALLAVSYAQREASRGAR